MRRRGAAVLVHETAGLASWLVEEGTCGPWGHLAVADGQGTLYEAWPGGVRRRPETEYATCTTADVDTSLTRVQRDTVVAWCQQHLGAAYNWPAIVVFGLRTLHADRWAAPPYRRLATWAQRRRALICSEMWVEALRAAGVDLWGGRASSEISPNDVALTAQVQALFYRPEAS